MSESSSGGKASSSPPTPSYRLSSRASSGSKGRAKKLAVEAAKTAALAAVPELALPAELATALVRSRRSSESSTPPSSPQVVLLPPRDREPLFPIGKDQIRVFKKKGITFVEVKRAHTLRDGLLEAALGLLAFETWNLKAQGYKPDPVNPGTWIPDLGLAWKGGLLASLDPASDDFFFHELYERMRARA